MYLDFVRFCKDSQKYYHIKILSKISKKMLFANLNYLDILRSNTTNQNPKKTRSNDEKIKMMRGVRDAKKVAQVVLVALFAPCVDTAFAFEKHNHSIMTQQQKDSGADLARAGIEEVEACMDAKKTHTEKLKSDPEYALRDKLNQKSNELSRVIGENYKNLVELTEKEGKLNEKFDPLYSDEAKLL